jgi:hypothetical protein
MATILTMERGGGLDEGAKPIVRRVSLDKLERIKRSRSTMSNDSGTVVGSTQLYDETGALIFCPAPTPDPKGQCHEESFCQQH